MPSPPEPPKANSVLQDPFEILEVLGAAIEESGTAYYGIEHLPEGSSPRPGSHHNGLQLFY